MKLPQAVKNIRDRFVAKFGLPHGTPDTIDGIARDWTIRLVQQVVYEIPTAGWGCKKADPGRPIGKDTIANKQGGLKCWDLLTGTGTGSPALVEDPDSLDIPEQVFVEVTGSDSLGDQGSGGGGTTPIPPGAGDELKAQLNRIEQKVDGIAGLVAHLEDLVKAGDDNNERRYQDLVNHIENKVQKGLIGTVRMPYLGTGSVNLDPKP